MQPPHSNTQVILGLATKSTTFLRAQDRCILRRRRLLPGLRRSHQFINAVFITPGKSISTRCNFRQPRANIWSRNSSNPTQLTLCAQAHPGLIHRLRQRGDTFQVLRKVLLGHRHGEIIPPGQLRAHVGEGLPLNLQLAKSLPRKEPRLKRRIGLTATQNVVNVCGDGSSNASR